jgi:hypothetical protein
VLLGAATNAAVQACVDKLRALVGAYRAVPDLALAWLDGLTITHVRHAQKTEVPAGDPPGMQIFAGCQGAQAEADHRHAPSSRSASFLLAVGGQRTHPPRQLYRLCKSHTTLAADVVVLDEAGQLGVAQAALVLRALRPGGRVVIAGDSEQLAPIRAGAYPAADAPLFGSVLDVVMHASLSPRERAAVPRPQPLARAGSGITASQESTIVQLTENFRCVP